MNRYYASSLYYNPKFQLKLIYSDVEQRKSGRIIDRSPSFVTIALQADSSTIRSMGRGEMSSDTSGGFYKQETQLYNWTPGMLGIYLKDINDELLAVKGEVVMYQSYWKREELAPLALDTLYVPQYLIADQRLNGQKFSAPELFRKYDYPFKVVDNNELDALIGGDREVFILEYGPLDYPNHYLRVLSSKTGRVFSRLNYKSLVRPSEIGRLD